MLKYKRLLRLLFSILLIFCMSITAFADEQTGSIAVTMKYNGSAVSGGTLTLYRVGNAQKENSGYKYTLTDDFAGSGAVLETEESADTAKTLASYASSKGISGTTLTINTNGKADFKDLEIGVYLIVQNTAASGYEKITPFLVNIPMLLDGGVAYVISTESEIYDVEASPKMSRSATTSSSSGGGGRKIIATATPTATATATDKPSSTDNPTSPNKPGTTSKTGTVATPRSTDTPGTTATPGSTDTPATADTPTSSDEPDTSISQVTDDGSTPSEETKKEETTSTGKEQQDVVLTPNTEAKATPAPKLPQTGQLNWPIPVLVVFGLTVFSIGWNLRFGKIRRR
jgi:hypothetical protein